MRKIKFRMWSKEAKKFFYDPENVFDCLKYKQIGIYPYDEMVWQQFTDLKDKNGKEIYEGDICRIYDKEEKPGVRYFQGDHWMDDGSEPFVEIIRHFKIVWDKEGMWASEYLDWFQTNAGDRNGEPIGGFIRGDFEVIGNIYENPELIKEMK